MYKANLIVIESMHKVGILNEEATILGVADIGHLSLESSSPESARIIPGAGVGVSTPGIPHMVQRVHYLASGVFQLVGAEDGVSVTSRKAVFSGGASVAAYEEAA